MELDNTRYVCALPLYHIFSLTANCLLIHFSGGAGHLIPNPRDFEGFVKELHAHPPMFFMGVNSLFNALMNTPGFDALDFSQLVATVGGGMAVQRAVAERWKQITGLRSHAGLGSYRGVARRPASIPWWASPSPARSGRRCRRLEITIRDDDGKELMINRGR